jgi:hypothetical protein
MLHSDRNPVAARVALALSVALATAASPAGAVDFLTGPAEGEPVDLALAYVDAQKEGLGLTAGDLADLVVRDEVLSRHNGVTHLYLRQRHRGVEVVNGDLDVHVMPDGRIVKVGNRFVTDLAGKVNAEAPAINAQTAVERAAAHLGLEPETVEVLSVAGGPAVEQTLSDAGISRSPIPAELMYLPRGTEARLVWSLVVDQVRSSDWWNLFVDAITGEVLEKVNWTVSERIAAPAGARTGLGPLGAVRQAPAPVDLLGCSPLGCYEVFAIPLESPSDGPRTIESDPNDPVASPFGWHDTDGDLDPDFTDSRGNNVEAQTDLDANNVFGPPDIRAEGGVNLDFSFPLDLDLNPSEYREAAVTNLFYWNNVMHDVTYRYGFDEAAGNFQQNNYGNGGIAGDPVQADAQDGSGCNNAQFGTSPDGGDGRMQMFVWSGLPNARVTVVSDYDAAKGCWGGLVDPPTTADLENVDDGTAPIGDGCTPLVGFTPGNIALIDRGVCEFGLKALNAEDAGASGAIIINTLDLPNGIISMGAGAVGGMVTIPAVMVGADDGAEIRSLLPTSGTIQSNPGAVDRDSDLDNGIIAHEYGHGISNRLVGGPNNVSCLSTNLGNEQMGEGLSDWWSLVLSPDPADTATTARGIGTYVIFEPPTGPGIRNFPYTTDLLVNPQTYADIGTTNVPHGVGEIYNAMLWEMYWNLVDEFGFDPDLYTGSGGNNIAIQLVVDGMKLTTCNPTFVDARDGILAADLATFGGAHECTIWEAFAKRGVGAGAVGGTSFVGDEIEDFTLPAQCNVIFMDGFESGDTTAWSLTVG